MIDGLVDGFTVGIIGLGRTGRHFVQLFQYGCRILAFDVDEKLKGLASKEGYEFLGCGSEVVAKSDVTVYCVDISEVVKVVEETASYARRGSLLTDVTSLKEEPVKAMLRCSHPDVDVIGMHPLYDPRGPMKGQHMVLTPARAKRWLDWLIGFLQNNGARIRITTPKRHDQLMALVQYITLISLT